MYCPGREQSFQLGKQIVYCLWTRFWLQVSPIKIHTIDGFYMVAIYNVWDHYHEWTRFENSSCFFVCFRFNSLDFYQYLLAINYENLLLNGWISIFNVFIKSKPNLIPDHTWELTGFFISHQFVNAHRSQMNNIKTY